MPFSIFHEQGICYEMKIFSLGILIIAMHLEGGKWKVLIQSLHKILPSKAPWYSE
jgi:hypothetical protein